MWATLYGVIGTTSFAVVGKLASWSAAGSEVKVIADL